MSSEGLISVFQKPKFLLCHQYVAEARGLSDSTFIGVTSFPNPDAYAITFEDLSTQN